MFRPDGSLTATAARPSGPQDYVVEHLVFCNHTRCLLADHGMSALDFLRLTRNDICGGHTESVLAACQQPPVLPRLLAGVRSWRLARPVATVWKRQIYPAVSKLQGQVTKSIKQYNN